MKKNSCFRITPDLVVNPNVILGKGSTGCVYQGRDLKKGQKIAVKIIDMSQINNPVTEYLLEMQKLALVSVKSQFILRAIKVIQNEKYCMIATEFCEGGTLSDEIRKSGSLNEKRSLQIIKDILKGYQTLVDKGILHRDLKPANIMLNHDKIKIIDFGYCQIEGCSKPNYEYNVGSPSYMAPQSYHKNLYCEKSDIWSIGTILFECLTGKTIDQGRNMDEVFEEMKTFGIKFGRKISQKCRSILHDCLSFNVQKRLTCSQLLAKIKLLQQKEEQALITSYLPQSNESSQKRPRSVLIQNFLNQRKTPILPDKQHKKDRNTANATQRVGYGILTNTFQQTMGRSRRMKTVKSIYSENKINQMNNEEAQFEVCRERNSNFMKTNRIEKAKEKMGLLDTYSNEEILNKKLGKNENRLTNKSKVSMIANDSLAQCEKSLGLLMKKFNIVNEICLKNDFKHAKLTGSIAYGIKNKSRNLRTENAYA